MYIMWRGLIMDGHATLTLTSLSLLYRFVNGLFIWALFLLRNTFLHAWSRLVMLCLELHYILSFDLYNVSMTLSDAT
jgi:hypothetical protein